MAAAEYYNSGPRPSVSQQPTFLPPPPPQRASSHPAITFSPPQQYPQNSQSQPYPSQYSPAPPPPPYQPTNENDKPGVHFTPSTTVGSHQGQRPSISYPQRPDQRRPQYSTSISNPPPGPYPASYNPQAYTYQSPDHLSQQQLRPPEHPSHSDYGYISDPEPHRRKHKHRTDRERRISESSRSSNADGFLGAAGGGLIGDLIFPGLGTVGGALAGWIGGKDYGKHRKWREDKRDREQIEWEQRFGHRSHSHGQDGRRGSHDRRRSYE